MAISAVLLAYKEAENLKVLFPKIKQQLDKIGEEYEIIIVDTMKPLDDTPAVCKKFGARYLNQRLPHFGGAFRTGIKAARYDKFLIMDSDGSHNPIYIPDIYKKFVKGADVVIGSRYVKGGKTNDSKVSIIMSHILNFVFRIITGIKAKDISTDFRMYDTKQLKAVKLTCQNYDILQEVLLKMKINNRKLVVKETPIIFEKRLYGESIAFFNRYCILILALVMLAVSVIHILPPFNADIINYDSSYQYFLTKHSLSDIMKLLPEDYSPPLYTLLLKLWTYIFGSSLLAMRSFSILIIWGLIFLAAFPVRAAFGKRASVICMLLYTLSYVNFLLVPEIRPTVLAYFLTAACAIYMYLALFKGYHYAYICMTVFAILGMYTHNVSMLAALSFYIVSFAFTIISKQKKKTLYFFLSGVVCALSYCPWLIVVMKQFSNVKKNYWANSIISSSLVIDWTYDIHFGYASGFVTYLIFIFIAIMLLIHVVKMRNCKTLNNIRKKLAPHRAEFVSVLYCGLMYVAPIITLILFTRLVYPIIATRYFYILSSLMVILLSVVIGKLFDTKLFLACIVLFIVSFCINFGNVKSQLDSSDFSDMIETIKENGDDDIAFLHLHEWSLGIMMYYFPDAEHYVCDDTWCVLNTLDVFPTEVTDIGSIDNINKYSKKLFIFGDLFPDSPYELDDHFNSKDDYDVTYLGMFTEPYTYKNTWRLYYVANNAQNTDKK